MQFPYKNKIDKFLVEICRFTGADEGLLPLPQAEPRQGFLARQVSLRIGVAYSSLLARTHNNLRVLLTISSSAPTKNAPQRGARWCG